MPSLAGAITYLALAAVSCSATADYAKAPPAGGRPDDGTFTRLAPSATAMRPYGDFAGKAASTSESWTRSDTYVLALQLGDINELDAQLTDSYALTLTMTARPGLGRQTADTYAPQLSLAITALQKATSPDRAVADSYTPVVTLACERRSTLPAADSYVPALTLSAALSASDAAIVADTCTVTLHMEPLLDAVVAAVTFPRADTYAPVLTLTAGVRRAGEVDRIRIVGRPCGLIRINEV